MITHKTAPPTMMAVRILRARVGANSRLNQPIQSESLGPCFEKCRAHKLFPRRTFDDRNRGRAHAEKILVRIFDFDTNGESLRDSDPIQFALHIRDTGGRQIDLAFGLHCPSDSLHSSTEALVRRGREVNNRFAARSNMSNLCFPKICRRRYHLRVSRNENTGIPTLAYAPRGNVQVNHATRERRFNFAIGKFELG